MKELQRQLHPEGLLSQSSNDAPLPGANLSREDWLRRYFPHVASSPCAPRHDRLWDWYEALRPGVRPRARVEVWPRGGAKSSTAELGCARVGSKLTRRFALYVSDTQDQADRHIQSIADLFETLGAGRLLNRYGSSKGWKRNQLRTANGFNAASFGLDAASRGVKLDQYRPDLVVLDDIDNQADTEYIREKKIAAITTAILPTGSPDCAILVIQNKIYEDSIVSQLCDDRADFLHGRDKAFVEPAIFDMDYESYTRDDGRVLFRIVGGVPSWVGQNLEACESQLNEWGEKAFLKEAQHEVEDTDCYVFNAAALRYCEILPDGRIKFDDEEVHNPKEHEENPYEVVKECRAWDLAATEGAGDHTASVRMGITRNKRIIVRNVTNEQWATEKVYEEISTCAFLDGSPWRVKLRLPQDPAQAGKSQAVHFRKIFAQFKPSVKLVTGSKVTRASAFADEVNKGNVWLVRGDWNAAYRTQLKKFREGVNKQQDDMVDASSDAYEMVAIRGENRIVRTTGSRRRRYGYA